MNTAMSTLSRFFSPRRRAAALPDAADMGTCFGLEMTLQRAPGPLESERAATAGPVPSAAKAPRRRWRLWPSRAARKAPATA